ncbi:MAG TPA: hypothetical protein ENJ32_01810 [Crenotrichaceae bacterium]|nr:hypothetical protein [Crenotrichaceae bacterium]
MLRFFSCVLVAFILSGCANKVGGPPDTSESFEHNPAVSAQTILISRKSSQQYQRCLTEQIKQYVNIDMDVRVSTGRIMKACEPEFNPIREAFKADHIPSQVTERYLSTKRSRSTPNILRVLMYAQSKRDDVNTMSKKQDNYSSN